ncbi:MAG: signal peptidase I [Bryobacteraceae bacterium]
MATPPLSKPLAQARPALPPNLERPAEEPRHWIADWTVTILTLLFGTTTLLQAFVVPTGSMIGTVLIGDHMIVDKLAYSPSGPVSKHLLPYQDVKRGDIIVFKYPLDPSQPYVKRAIGIPGDRIRFENKTLILNGRRIEEPYRQLDSAQTSDYLNNFPREPDIMIETRGREMLAQAVEGNELVVPAGSYYAMGDNRDNSADSRFWGFVPRENIVGKPVIIFWSYDAPTENLIGGTLNPTHLLDLAQHFFSQTRWKRTLRLVRPYPLGS